MEKNNGTFSYTYSAKQREEIDRIRKKYIRTEESKLDRLRSLDEGVTRKGTAAALALGILGTLVMGIGMCCCLVWASAWFISGIFIGLAGIVTMTVAYPIYNRICHRERERVAPEILRLIDELTK